MQTWIEDPKKEPKWLILRRTVLIPKTKDLSSEKDYKPIRCLNTPCKVFNGILGQHVKKQLAQNDLLDKNQMATCEKVDNIILGEVKDRHRYFAVA